ncbi:MAG: N-6 DNA methylase [Pirellulaceae bacterium]
MQLQEAETGEGRCGLVSLRSRSYAIHSRITAQILGIRQAKTCSKTTVYDPTCGSGLLLFKRRSTLYGQEKDATTRRLAAWMNMILHNNPIQDMAAHRSSAEPIRGYQSPRTTDYLTRSIRPHQAYPQTGLRDRL